MATDEASSSSERSNQPDSTNLNSEETLKKYIQLNSFLKSFCPEKKKSDFLVIRIEELRYYLLNSFKKNSVLQTFDEAIEFASTNINENEVDWRFWQCHLCQNKFTYHENIVKHLVSRHELQVLESKIRAPDARWNDKILTWKPVDVLPALQNIADHRNLSDDDLVELELPLSDDNNRTQLLRKVVEILKFLLKRNSFPDSNRVTIMDFIRNDLNIVFPKFKHAIERIAKLGLGIMFLDASQLEDYLNCLRILADDSIKVSLKNSEFFLLKKETMDAKTTVQEKIGFSKDKSCLLLDERLLTSAIVPQRYLVQCTSVSGVSTDDAFVDWLLCSELVIGGVNYWNTLKTMINNDIIGSVFLDSYNSARDPSLSWVKDCMTLSKTEKELRDFWGKYCLEIDNRNVGYEGLSLMWTSGDRDLLENLISQAKTLDVAGESKIRQPWAWARRGLYDIANADTKLGEEDASFKLGLHKYITEVAFKQCRIDSKRLRIESLLNTVADVFKETCGLDYRAILLIFVKSFLQDKIEKRIKEKMADDSAAESLKEEKQDPGAMGKQQK